MAGTRRGGALLDLGSSDGETLRHMAELRPDLRFFAVDKIGRPEAYPRNCQFQSADLERDRLPWPDGSMDAITCMHVVEHLNDLEHLWNEAVRLVVPGGAIYFETPHPRSLTLPRARDRGAGTFTLNFYDDATHVRIVPVEELGQSARAHGLEVVRCGTSRNWLFAASYPAFQFLPASRKKFTARVHWVGWSAYLVARRPL